MSQIADIPAVQLLDIKVVRIQTNFLSIQTK